VRHRRRWAWTASSLLVLVLGACSSFSSSAPDAPADGGAPDGGALADGGAPADAAVSAYRGAVLSDRPIAYWRMGTSRAGSLPNEVDTLNPLLLQGAGSTVGVPGALAGDGDTAVQFDGFTGLARASQSRPFDFANGAPFSIECWAKHEPVNGGAPYQQLFALNEGSGAQANGYNLYFTDDTNMQADFQVPNQGVTLTATITTAASWTHYVLTFDGIDFALYANGTQMAKRKVSGALAPRTLDFTVGAQSDGAYHFPGAIDEVAIYDRALTLERILAHYYTGIGQ
jgi:hypothetical protein